MKLPPLPTSAYLLCGAALLLPALAGTAVVFARQRANAATRTLQEVLGESRQLEGQLQQLAARKPAVDAILATEENLQQKCEDARQPALVVAEMGSTCNQAGIRVQSIRPARAKTHLRNGKQDANPPTACQLTLRADCASLCKLLDQLRETRLPLQVTSLTVEAEQHGPDKPFGTLRADVGIEAFQLKPQQPKELRP